MTRLKFQKGPSGWCMEGPFPHHSQAQAKDGGAGDKGRGSPHRGHDNQNTFRGAALASSPLWGTVGDRLGTGTSKTGSDGSLLNKLQACVTIITQHPIVILRQQMGLNHNSNESQVPG